MFVFLFFSQHGNSQHHRCSREKPLPRSSKCHLPSDPHCWWVLPSNAPGSDMKLEGLGGGDDRPKAPWVHFNSSCSLSVAIQTKSTTFPAWITLTQPNFQESQPLIFPKNSPTLRLTPPPPSPLIRPCFRRHRSGRSNNGSPDFGPRHVPTRGPSEGVEISPRWCYQVVPCCLPFFPGPPTPPWKWPFSEKQVEWNTPKHNSTNEEVPARHPRVYFSSSRFIEDFVASHLRIGNLLGDMEF